MSDAQGAARNPFFNDEDELRCGWRVIIFVVAFLIFATLFGSVIAPLFERTNPDRSTTQKLGGFFLQTIIGLCGVLAASALCARLLERRSLASVGYKLHPGWWRDFGLGLILGAVTLGVAVGIIYLGAAVSFRTQTTSVASLAPGFTALFIFFLLAAAFEELLTRGFAFQALAHNLGPAVAIAVTSLVFGLLHLRNQSATVFSTANTVLAGVWLGTAYWMTQSLWLATALHMSWNFAMAFIFGLPVSGIGDLIPLAWTAGQPGTPAWLSGGNYGPEGGVAATIALLLCTLVIWKTGLWTASSEMVAALRHGTRDRLSIVQEPRENP